MNRCIKCGRRMNECTCKVVPENTVELRQSLESDLSDRTKHIPIDEIKAGCESEMMLVDAHDRAAIKACRDLPPAALEAGMVEMMVKCFNMKSKLIEMTENPDATPEEVCQYGMSIWALEHEIIKLLEVK